MDYSIVDILRMIFSNLFYLVLLLFLFGLTIFVHELGHFLTAFRFKMVIDVFSIGFGHAIWKKKIKNIWFKIGWIPLGGYVALPQLDPTGMSSVQSAEGEKSAGDKKEEAKAEPAVEKADKVQPKEEEIRTLPDVSPWKKIVVAFAGSFGNILLAILISWFIYLNPFSITNDNAARIGFVEEESAAYGLGVRPGDVILKVGDQKVGSWYEYIVECVLKHKNDKEAEVTLQTGDSVRKVTLPMLIDKVNHRYGVPGIHPVDIVAVSKVDENSPLAAAGLKKADIVREVDGIKVDSMIGFTEVLKDKTGRDVSLLLERGNKQLSVNLVPAFKPVGQIGVKFTEKNGHLSPMIDEVFTNRPADIAGLQKGDVIKSIDGVMTDDVRSVIRQNAGKKLHLVVARQGADITVDLTPASVADELDCGIQFGEVSTSPWMQFRDPWKQLQNDAMQIFRILKALVTPAESSSAASELGGPVMILTMLWLSMKMSLLNALGFIRFINVNLAIVNLLPIPVLDGGHIVFALWEGITRRRANPKLVNALVNFFAFLLIGAILFITFRDILNIKKIFGRKSRAAAEAVVVSDTNKVEAVGSVTNK